MNFSADDHATRSTGLRLVSAQAPNDERAQRDQRQVNGQSGAGVNDLDHDANFLKQFHPACSLLGRDDAGVGVGGTGTHPAGDLWKHDSPRDPEIPLAVPPRQFCADARHVVGNPELYADRPILRRLAWLVLLAEQGHSVGQLRYAQMTSGAV